MDTKGLFLGIDIDEDISQVCFYDKVSRNVQPVMAKKDSPFFQNNVPLSRIFENEESAPARLSSMLDALITAAKEQTGEEQLNIAGVCLHDYSEDKRLIWHEAFRQLGIPRESYLLLGKEETFAYYAFSADPGTYTRGVVLFDMEPSGLTGCFLQRVTFKGLTLLTESDDSLATDSVKMAGGGETPLEPAMQDICGFFKKTLDKNPVSSVYLTGTAFDTEELPSQMLAVLGRRGHRIFAGMNLYVKGACIGALAKAYPMADPFRSAGIYKNVSVSGEAAGVGGLARCIMACRNRISSEICLVEKKDGELKSRTLVARGTNADLAGMSFDLIAGEHGEIQIEVSPLTQNTPDIYRIRLETDKDPSKEIVRVNTALYFPNEDTLAVYIRGINGSCRDETLDIDLRGSGKQTVRTRSDGVIVCDSNVSEVPYVFPETGSEFYSEEELVKFLYENIYLTGTDRSFINGELFSFLRDGTGNKELADRLEEIWKAGCTVKDFLIELFKGTCLYTSRDINIIEPVIEELKTGKRPLVKYGRAETFIKCGCLSKAVKELTEIMEMNPDSELPESFYAKVLYNAGVCYARCLMYEKAAVMFEGSYGFVKDDAAKSAALLCRRLSGTEPQILYMKGEWEQAGEKAGKLSREFSQSRGMPDDFDEAVKKLKQDYVKKYS